MTQGEERTAQYVLWALEQCEADDVHDTSDVALRVAHALRTADARERSTLDATTVWSMTELHTPGLTEAGLCAECDGVQWSPEHVWEMIQEEIVRAEDADDVVDELVERAKEAMRRDTPQIGMVHHYDGEGTFLRNEPYGTYSPIRWKQSTYPTGTVNTDQKLAEWWENVARYYAEPRRHQAAAARLLDDGNALR